MKALTLFVMVLKKKSETKYNSFNHARTTFFYQNRRRKKHTHKTIYRNGM